MWKYYALLSAVFAALTAILAKVGVRDIDSNLATAIRTTVILAITWGVVLATGIGGKLRELTGHNLLFLVLSGIATGLSWLFYFKALQTGDASRVAPIDKLSVAITIFLGISIAFNMHAVQFLRPQTLLIMGLGLVAFIFDTAGGVLVAKFLNLFLPKGRKINPMIGAAGISAFPMSSRVIHKMGLKEDPQNFLLMHTVGVNVSGQIASVIAGGLIMSLVYTIG